MTVRMSDIKRAGLVALIMLSASTLAVGTAKAAPQCGEPPMTAPAIPDGTRVDRDAMLAGVNDVKAYSEQVDAYLSCKDERAVQVFQWMNEEQRARWEEDLNKIHEHRVEVQRQMNEAIRVFNSNNADDNTG